MKKQYFLLVSLFLLIATLSACLSDIRTPYLKDKGVSDANIKKGKTLLKEMAAAHGMDAYLSHKNVQIKLRDEWTKGIKRAAAMPWHKNKELVQLQYLVNTYDSRLMFLEGKAKNDIWGLQNWMSYEQKKGEEAVLKKSKKIKFWLPTVQYFMMMPFAIQEAEIVSYAGEEMLNGKKYDLVFASWKTDAPQKNIDQYLLWINQQTKLLEIAQYSIRDMAGFMKGAMTYEDFKEIDGVTIGFKQTATGVPGNLKKYLHRYWVEDFQFDVEAPKNSFYPAPDRYGDK